MFSPPPLAPSPSRLPAAEKWDMASGFPDNNFHTKNIQEFIAKIKQGTKELDFILHSNQALFKLQDSKKAVQSGPSADRGASARAVRQRGPDLRNQRHPLPGGHHRQGDASYGRRQGPRPLSDRLAKDGIRLLYGVTWPVQGFYAKTPITSVANFKGVKMRTYSADDRPHGRGDGRDPDQRRVQRDPAGVLDRARLHDVHLAGHGRRHAGLGLHEVLRQRRRQFHHERHHRQRALLPAPRRRDPEGRHSMRRPRPRRAAGR